MCERFVVVTQRRLAELRRRDLSGLKLVALLIAGVHIADHVVVVAAVGFEVDGVKHPLGLREGATENAAACKALLEELIGLNLNRAILVVSEGAKALRGRWLIFSASGCCSSAARHTKKRPLLESLPERMRALSVRRAMSHAYASWGCGARPPAA